VEIAAWRRSAACRDQGPKTFFTPTAEAEAEAKKICGECPVRMPCLHMAIDQGLVGGVFGGANDDERDRVAHRLKRRVWMISAGRLGAA
jgi:WhiB family redox-sensing transcriptional regulator